MKRLSKILAAAVGCGALFTFANVSPAAIIATFDLRETGTNSKAVTISSPSQVVHLSAYIQIVNNDSNHVNDTVAGASVAFISAEDASGLLLGNIGNVVKSSAFSIGSLGLSNNLDANGDTEWGSTSGTSSTGNFNPASASPVAGVGTGSGVTEIFLGSFDWTGIANLPVSLATTSLNMKYFRNTANTRGSFTITSDGVTVSQPTATGDADSFLAVGAPVVLSTLQNDIPEPASVGVLGLAGLALLARRRR